MSFSTKYLPTYILPCYYDYNQIDEKKNDTTFACIPISNNNIKKGFPALEVSSVDLGENPLIFLIFISSYSVNSKCHPSNKPLGGRSQMVSHIPIFWQKMLSNFSSQTLVENLQEENCFIQTKVLTIKWVPMYSFSCCVSTCDNYINNNISTHVSMSHTRSNRNLFIYETNEIQLQMYNRWRFIFSYSLINPLVHYSYNKMQL